MHDFAWLIVFIGRPNAGKSSFISRLTKANPTIGRKPGSTRKITEYTLAHKFKVVDIPGWGRIHSRSQDYEDFIKDEILDYFEVNRFQIPACIQVIDAKSLIDVSERLSKKGIIPIDKELYFYLKDLKLNPIVVLNKIDKISQRKATKAEAYFKEMINFDSLKPNLQKSIITASAKKGDNLGVLRDLIRERLRAKGIEEYERHIKVR